MLEKKLILLLGFLAMQSQILFGQASSITPASSASRGPVFQIFDKPNPLNSDLSSDAVLFSLRKEVLHQILSEKPGKIQLRLPGSKTTGTLTLDLTQSFPLADDFKVVTSDGKALPATQFQEGMVHYTGKVGGTSKSLAAISFFDDWLMGVIEVEGITYDLGSYGDRKSDQYVFYNAAGINGKLPFTCLAEGSETPSTQAITGPYGCSRLFKEYFECDYQMFTDFSGTTGVTNYLSGLYNVVALLYDNENIATQISEIFVWTTPDPYTDNSTSSPYLNEFRNTRTTFNGDLAHFLTTRDLNAGGLASVDVLCVPGGGYAFSNIETSYSLFPTYSWSVEVVTHEIGHNLGSPHTHSCSWPGGPIDNCSLPSDGPCVTGPTPPAGGGTIMSYCHLVSTVGIALTNGFGPLPGNLIRSRVGGSSCLATTAGSTTMTLGCIPTTPNPGNNFNMGPIVVSLNTINYNSGGSAKGVFQDLTCAIGTNLLVGNTYTITVTTETNPQKVRAYIDYDGSNTFEAGELILTSNGVVSPQDHSATFTVPAGTTQNLYRRMRVVADFTSNPNPDPCGSLLYGQAEDYRIIFTNGALPAGTLASGNQTFCGPGANPANITFSALPSTGAAFQWYYKDGIAAAPASGDAVGTWLILNGQTGSSYDPPSGLQASRTYACRVSNGVTNLWASGARQITLLTGLSSGTLASMKQYFTGSGDPGVIGFATIPTGGTGITYQWYSQSGIQNAPVGTSVAGWTLISGATGSTYNPPAQSTSISYACFVGYTGVSGCTGEWASGVRQIEINPTTIAMTNGNATVCSSAFYDSGVLGNYANDENYILTFYPSTAGAKVQINFSSYNLEATYDYLYLYNGPNTSAGLMATLNGVSATSTTYTSTAADGSITCRFVSDNVITTSGWVATITCSNVLNLGTIETVPELVCNPGDPALISFTTPPSGAASFAYAWYYQNGSVSAPTGSSTTGWTVISGAVSSSYNPPSGLTANRTYACFVTPSTGTAGWASGARQVVVMLPYSNGTLVGGNLSLASPADPPSTTFSSSPGGSGSFTYQWYYQDGIAAAPTGSTTTGWTLISGATSLAYDAPSGLTASRSYACFVTPGPPPLCGTAGWASGVRQITVTTFSPGTLATANQTLCNPADPASIAFSTAPSGAAGYAYAWYFQAGIIAAPTGSATTGWTVISGATASSYDPPSGVTASRTYACFVTPSSGTAAWASGARQVTVLPALSLGTLTAGNQTLSNPADPASITFSASPAGSGSFAYQWYYQNGIIAAPTGAATTGWTIITGATANSYDPPSGLTASRSFACFVTPGGTPSCGSAGWASGVRQVSVNTVTFSPGTVASGDQTICFSGDPASISFATAPSAGSTTSWYYQNGLVAAPANTAPTTGWTAITGATASSYDPPTGLTASRTYACRVVNGASNQWATGVRQVVVLPAFNPGVITAGDQSFCTSGDPAAITLSTNPVGSGGYSWRWYFRETTIGDCPIGSAVPTGWTTNSTSPNITGTTLTGAGITFDPQSAGTLNNGRTFAVLITPIANGGIPACGTPQWAAACRKTAVVNCSFSPGTLTSGNQILCNPSDPASIGFATAPTTGSTYQWYYQNGIMAAPANTAALTGWTIITGSTGASYDPPSGLTQSRTFACRVTNGANSQWATGVRQVTLLAVASLGALAAGNQTLSNPAGPASITFSASPAGSGSFAYQWYYQNGIIAAPTGSATTGWTIITSATANSYDPPSGLTASRSFACFVTPGGTPSCGSAGWASGVRQVTVNTVTFSPGTLASGDQTLCFSGDPASISFATAPSAGSTTSWYYQNGLVAAPANTAPTTGWTAISGATASSYDPPTGLTASRTYACRVVNGASNQWATGVRQVSVLPVFNPGTIAANDQSGCAGFNPDPVTFSVNPVGSGAYNWKWYYWPSTTMTCPVGSTPPAGGTSSTTDVRYFGTSLTGAGISFDPTSSGASPGRTWAVLITPVANGTVPGCGLPAFATSCRKTITLACREPASGDRPGLAVESATLAQNVPNPFEVETAIECFVPEGIKEATLDIYSTTGIKMAGIQLKNGQQTIVLKREYLKTGAYFYVLNLDNKVKMTKKMIVLP